MACHRFGRLLLVWTLYPAVAVAQVPPTWTRPVVTDARCRIQSAEDRQRRPFPCEGGRLELPIGTSVLLEIEPRDQYGRPFPRERAAFGLEAEPVCADLVNIQGLDGTTFQITARQRRGRCGVSLWTMGNLNLAWSFRVEVTSRAHSGYSRAEAEYIVTGLYRALLNRDPDPGGFSSAVAEVQHGRLESLVEAMVKSREFAEKRPTLTTPGLLEQIYRGLLKRPPDSQGVRRYWNWIEQNRVRDVVLDIIRSEEFEAALVTAAGRR